MWRCQFLNMNTIKFEEKENVKMIAHRGLSGIERENTCPAFTAAGAKSYFGIETDVHLTRDGKFILCHDSNLERVVGVKMIIEEEDFDTLRAVRFTDICNDKARADVFLPSLDEYLHICGKYEKEAVLEIKGSWSEDETARLAESVTAAGMIEQTTFISFSKESCLGIRKAYPGAKVQFLFNKDLEDGLSFCLENNFDADMSFRIVTENAVSVLHSAGLLVNCWTVNTVADAERMKECGVDMITTNILE